jgi:2-hydroxy-3-keto-5-methylthiopentenyl-1-phosphate phosphatase
MSFDLSNIKIEKIAVQAKSRTLNASWTMEHTLSEEEWNELQQKEYEVLAKVADQPEVYHQMMSLLGLSYSDYLNKIENESKVVNEINEELAKVLQEEIDKEILASLSIHLDAKR